MLSHEGRFYYDNYLWEFNAESLVFGNQLLDDLLPGPRLSADSVGLGQVQPNRAMHLEEMLFGHEVDYRTAGYRLIFNNRYSVALTAAAIFENCVLFMGGGPITLRTEFLAYALSPASIRAFASVGWNLDAAEAQRSRLGLTQGTIDTLRRRNEVELPQAVSNRRANFGY